jgi:membrane fusion protein (multidrug efflux system)
VRRRALLLLVAIAALAGCARERENANTVARATVSVRVAPVRLETAPTLVEITGTVRPAERAVVASKISGVVESLPLTLGQTVKRGDLLIRLTAPELAARLAQTRAQLAQAEREEQRTRELAANGADTADAALSAAERLRAARAATTEAEAMLAYAEIRAPYDGRVAQKLAYTGDFATSGDPLLVLESSATLQIETAVPASLAASLALGANVRAWVVGVAEPFACTVAEIAGAADSATHTVLVKLALPATDARLSGRFARIEFTGPAAEALLAPTSAVTRFGQMERVFVVVDGRAQLRLVKTGAARGDRIELLAGVSAGENIVVTPGTTLRDGQPVTSAP